MSQREWTENGYGYTLYKDFGKIKEFIVENGDFPKETKEEMKGCTDYCELEECAGDPIAWVVAKIINTLENITYVKGFREDGDTNQEAMLGIEPLYPWQMEKPLERDEADSILNKYAKILGITEKPDYFSATYYG